MRHRTAVYGPVRTVVWQGKIVRSYLCSIVCHALSLGSLRKTFGLPRWSQMKYASEN
jgi:hypothetical protein